jgi:hypothetical protein
MRLKRYRSNVLNILRLFQGLMIEACSTPPLVLVALAPRSINPSVSIGTSTSSGDEQDHALTKLRQLARRFNIGFVGKRVHFMHNQAVLHGSACLFPSAKLNVPWVALSATKIPAVIHEALTCLTFRSTCKQSVMRC